jgi:hypothetical protein
VTPGRLTGGFNGPTDVEWNEFAALFIIIIFITFSPPARKVSTI